MSELLSMEEVRKTLGIGHGTVWRLMDTDPDFKTLKIGGRRMMRRETLDQYLEIRERREAEERGVA